MEADCQWKNLVWRLSPSRGLGRKINEQDRSSIESEDKSRCSDRDFGVFYHNSRNCTVKWKCLMQNTCTHHYAARASKSDLPKK